jgi:hypothetical protein
MSSLWRWLTLILPIALVARCGQADIDLTYPTGTQDLVIVADSEGGYVPEAYVQSHIPLFRLYGDGYAVWSEWQDGQTSVWEGLLAPDEITALLEWIAGRRFFGLDGYYAPKNPPTDLPTDCVRVQLVNEQKSVCEYHSGAPRAFGEVYGRLTSGAGASEVTAYQPEIGWVIVEPITWATSGEADTWPGSLEPAPSAMGEGMWVEGEVLAFLWQGRLEQGPWMVYKDGEELYGLVLQVPGLMPQAPQAP